MRRAAVLPLFIATAALSAQDLDRAFVDALVAKHKPTPLTFQFALIGDQQYSVEEEQQFPLLLKAMEREPLAFIVHDGDFKGGSPCTDELFRSRFVQFDATAHPFIFTPGDNDWTDCHREDNGTFDPLERLTFLRRLFFATPEVSLGRRKLPLTSQTTQRGFELFRENALWTMGEVVFATFHIVGSLNGTGRTAASDEEAMVRTRAALMWIKTAFALATEGKFKAIMLITQANPRFDLDPPGHPAFADVNRVLEQESRAFAGEVVFVHGDTHYFRIDKPLPMPARARSSGGPSLVNFTRVETFGPPDLHWIRVRVAPDNPAVFVFEPQITR